MKIKAKIKNAVEADNHAWEEEYSKPDITTLAEAHNFLRDLVAKFNATLRPGEQTRALLSFEAQEDLLED